MSNKPNGFSAFPLPLGDEQIGEHSAGMTLRDYFAAKASASIDPPADYVGVAENNRAIGAWARRCYRMADAMLAERDK